MKRAVETSETLHSEARTERAPANWTGRARAPRRPAAGHRPRGTGGKRASSHRGGIGSCVGTDWPLDRETCGSGVRAPDAGVESASVTTGLADFDDYGPGP